MTDLFIKIICYMVRVNTYLDFEFLTRNFINNVYKSQTFIC